MGSGCGAVGRAVACDTRGPGFESSHWQLLLDIYLLLTVCKKTKINKRGREWPIFKKILILEMVKQFNYGFSGKAVTKIVSVQLF